jgi:putative dehydrogenase
MLIALVAQGAMGAAVGRVLVDNGARVVTSLAGRGAASAKRAEAAGMIPVSDAEFMDADMILSIVPPGDALTFAQRMAPHLRGATKKPLFVDCNAVSPDTAEKIGDVIASTGAAFVDAGIIGGPPRKGVAGPSFYASGKDAARFASLRDFGLDTRVLDAPIGAASALKMSYAGITKGLTAIGSAMMLSATRAGAAKGLRDELAESQPSLTPWFERQIPGMYQKAYRWVAEMREIADFASADPAAAAIYEGVAQFYERMAVDEEGDKKEIGALSGFLARTPEPSGPRRKIGYKEMLAAAEKDVTTLSIADAVKMRAREDVTLVDLRDPRELDREGKIPNALHCPRGMLEFWIDPESPYFKPIFGEDKTFVFFCAAGWRSALATQTAQRMGLEKVAHIGGGFKAWKEADGETEAGAPRA